jgi:hypothetical protein
VEEARGDAGLKALLALGAAGLLIAGCGKDEKEATTSKSGYERAFKDAVAQAEKAPPIQLPKNASLEQQALAVEQGLERERALAAALARIEPPGEVRHAHELFVSGLRRFLRAGDQAAAARLLGPNGGALDPLGIKQVTTARQEFAAKGYDLGPVSRRTP